MRSKRGRFRVWGLFAAMAGAGVLAGCSGPGAPVRSGPAEDLQTLANDHLTALLHVKRWLAILYPPTPQSPCATSAKRTKRQPGDPPGSLRMRLVLSDCTQVDVFQLADGSGSQVVLFPDGATKTVTWGVARRDDAWVRQDITEALWDGHQLAYEVGISTAGAPYDRYEDGTATLGDGRAMQFRHDRNTTRDALSLQPDDGTALQFQAPLQTVDGSPFHPVRDAGVSGEFRSAAGGRQTFSLRGTDANGWETWTLAGAEGFTGRFTVGADLSGAGSLSQGGEVVAALDWDADGAGQLTPLGASSTEAGPAAAARDFQIDQWIRNIAALGPSPMY